jgi:hypothetical protein
MASSLERQEDNNEDVEFFLSAEPYKIDYKGPCTVDIKLLAKMLVIEPFDKRKRSTEISVYSHFVQHKNILFNPFSCESASVALVFPTINACKTVFDIIMGYQVDVKQEVEDGCLNQRQILIPLLHEARTNPTMNKKTKYGIIYVLQDCVAIEDGGNVKSELGDALFNYSLPSSSEPIYIESPDMNITSSLNEYDINTKEKTSKTSPDAFAELIDTEVVKREEPCISMQIVSRKRRKSPEYRSTAVEVKQCNTETLDEQQQLPLVQPETNASTLILQTKKVIQSSHFLVHKITSPGRPRCQLMIFVSDEKNLCYPYAFERKNTLCRFLCMNCQKNRHYAVAHLRCEEDGEYYVELGLIKHICTPVIYVRQRDETIVPCTLYSALFFGAPTKYKKRIFPGQIQKDDSEVIEPTVVVKDNKSSEASAKC